MRKIQIDKNKLQLEVSKAKTYTEVALALNISAQTVKRLALDFEIDISHFVRYGYGNALKHPISEYLVKRKTNTRCKHIRKRLIDENYLEYKCFVCGINEWLGKDISLELDHIDGVRSNYELENLRFLCPNCHSQTDTWRGKKRKTTGV